MIEHALEIANRYFTHLSLFGYYSLCDMHKAILYLTLLDWLKEYGELFTQCDLVLISRILNCLEGSSCLIPAEKDIHVSDLISIITDNLPRVSEDFILRLTENSCPRTAY